MKLTGDRGSSLSTKCWKVEEEKCNLLLIHGIGEHAGRFEKLAKSLNNHQITVYAYDQQGHGRNEGKRGYARVATLEKDIVVALKKIREESEKPIFLYGHSMGGGLSIYTTLRNELDVRGVIITSPWLKLCLQVPSFVHTLIVSHDINFGRVTIPNGIAAKLLSRDQKVGEAFVKDPLTHNKIAIALYGDMERAANYSLTHASALKVPMLLCHGQEDRICSVEGSRMFARQTSMCTYVEFPEAYHEIHNERMESEQLVRNIIAFINDNL